MNETNCKDKAKNEKLSQRKKTLDEEKLLRKKIRHLGREDERQAKSLTQDLKDIRESLSHVNKVEKNDGSSVSQSRNNKNSKETEDDSHCGHSTTTKTRQDRKYEVKTTEKCQLDQRKALRSSSSEGNCAWTSKQKTSSPLHHTKNVGFKDNGAPGNARESGRKQNETILSLSNIDLK